MAILAAAALFIHPSPGPRKARCLQAAQTTTLRAIRAPLKRSRSEQRDGEERPTTSVREDCPHSPTRNDSTIKRRVQRRRSQVGRGRDDCWAAARAATQTVGGKAVKLRRVWRSGDPRAEEYVSPIPLGTSTWQAATGGCGCTQSL